MSRLIAFICLALALLCPVLCIAETAEDRCGPADGEVCEAMAVGAVITVSNDGLVSLHALAPSLDGVLPVAISPPASLVLWSSTRCDRTPRGLPPNAARRQALLQRFLF
ncbi:hypothetical protein [Singulisphaera sp. PoT]|uniref:hypothetical protein n=1 Tax=Singulisphaera sp. PoT TaxID=3411797 RepID=UPI003BF4AA5E